MSSIGIPLLSTQTPLTLLALITVPVLASLNRTPVGSRCGWWARIPVRRKGRASM
jgi:hypothetical protein